METVVTLLIWACVILAVMVLVVYAKMTDWRAKSNSFEHQLGQTSLDIQRVCGNLEAEQAARKQAEDAYTALTDRLREKAKESITPKSRVRRGSYADIRKANESANLAAQEREERTEADTAFVGEQ